MNLLKTFEQRVADAFGAAPQGYTAPFSFKRLARRAAREMERETFVIDGVNTAPALYTVLVSPTDDVAMRVLYPQLTTEVVEYVKGEAARKGYVFVGEPLARFMVDESLHSGKFVVFAENIDAQTLQTLRQEEAVFLQSSSVLGGAAAELANPPAKKQSARRLRPTSGEGQPARRPAARAQRQEPTPQIKPIPTVNAGDIARQPVAAAPLPSLDDSASAGLDVIPMDFLDDRLPAGAQGESDPLAEPLPSTPLGSSIPSVLDDEETEPVTCLLVDHQSGRTYTATAPSTLIGRERTKGNVVLRDPNVSRIHAELNFDGHVWRIRDLGSTNGTLVNDVDITQKVLRDGDVITIGLINLEFREN